MKSILFCQFLKKYDNFCFSVSLYSESCLNQTSLGSTLVFGIDSCFWFIQVKLTKISCTRTLFKVRFIQDFGLLMFQFRHVSPYLLSIRSFIVKQCLLLMYINEGENQKSSQEWII